MNRPERLLSRSTCLLVALSTFSIGVIAPGTCAAASAITIGANDFLPSRSELVTEARSLSELPTSYHDTADYARRYQALQDHVLKIKPGISTWKSSERGAIKAVPRPSSEGVAALHRENQQAQAKRAQREAEVDQYWDERAAANQKAQQAQADAQRRADEQAAQDARYNQALQDAYNNDYGYGPAYYYPVTWPIYSRPPGHTHHPGDHDDHAHHGGHGSDHSHGDHPVPPASTSSPTR